MNDISYFIKKNDNFLLITHSRPDGDALGSIFSLHQALINLGKKSTLFLDEKFNDEYNSSCFAPFLVQEELPKLDEFSCCISLDAADTRRLGIGETKFEDINIPIINIDHHPDNKMFGKLNYINSEIASCAEIVLDLLKIMELPITKEIATTLMLGIVSDSGSFRFNNTKSHTFRNAAQLIAAGANYQDLIKDLYFSKSLKNLQFESEFINTELRLAFENQFAYAYVNPKLLKKHNLKNKETGPLIDIIRSIKGVEIAALITIIEEGKYKFSLRSINTKYSVGEVARSLDGGGHELAAGCALEAENLAEVEKILLDKIGEMLNS